MTKIKINFPEKKTALIISAILIATIFYPLLFGENFLPFTYYDDWGVFLAKASKKEYKIDELYAQSEKNEPSMRERDMAGLSFLFPNQKLIADSLRKGTIPLWDPYIGCGLPTFGSGQFRPFNPFQIPFYLFPNLNIYSFSIFLEIIAGFIFMFIFLSRCTNSYYSSSFGALLFVLNPFVFNRLSFLDHLAAYFFIPLLLVALEEFKEDNLRSVILTSIPFIIMGNVGHPEMCFIASLVSAIYYIVNSQSALKEKIIRLLRVGFFVIITLSIYIFPLLKEYFSGFSYKRAGISKYVFSKWQYLFTPTSDIFLMPILIFFIVLSLNRLKDKKVLFFFSLMIISLLFLTGIISPKWTFIIIPPFYFKFLFWISVSFLATYGFDKIINEKVKWHYYLPFILWFFAIFLGIELLKFPFFDYFKGSLILIILLIIPILIVVIFAKLQENDRLNSKPALLLFFAIFPLCYPLSNNLIPWNSYEFRSYDILDIIKSDYKNERVCSFMHRPFTALPMNNGSSYGIRTFEANCFLFPNTYYQQFGVDSAYPTFVPARNYRPNILRRAGVTIILAPNEYSEIPLKSEIQGEFVSLYKIPEAKGRVFFASKVFSINGDEDSIRDAWLKILPLDDSVVFAECPIDIAENAKNPSAQEVHFIEDSFHKVKINAKCDSDSFLVLRDTFSKEWQAFINGKKTKIFRVDGCFRGVIVPAGENIVEFKYSPQIFYISTFLTMFSFLLIFGVLFLRRKAG